MQVGNQVVPEFRVEVQDRIDLDFEGGILENVGGRSWGVDCPCAGFTALFHGPAPLDEAGLFADMDFLARTYQADDDGPFRDALAELDETGDIPPPSGGGLSRM